MFKKLLLTALLAATANFGFSQLTVHNNTGGSITLSIHSYDGATCASHVSEGSFTLAPGPNVIPITPGNVGMRVVFYYGMTFVGVETEPAIPAGCTDVNDPWNVIVWTGSSNVHIN
jgi:hypothetical protein